MQILMTILYILLFLVCLSVLIMIHELGHLAAAKAFKVYCLEYSIGMGPLLFKHKRKNGETQFSIRAIPFGGYVSMYGEGVELTEGVTVDQTRSLNGIKPWKRAIVLLAGVTMNALLALTILFITNCFPHTESDYVNHVNVAASSPLAGVLNDGTYIKFEQFDYEDTVANAKRRFYLVDKETTFDGGTDKYASCFYFESIKNRNDLDLSKHLYFYELKEEMVEEELTFVPDFTKRIENKSFTTALIHFTERVPGEDGKLVDGSVVSLEITQKDDVLDSFGLSIYCKEVRYNFGEIIGHTFIDFGESSTAIVRALGDLFVKPSSWSNMGGIIAIGFESTAILKEAGFISFLRLWAIISVNLAIFNLLPFPGLDGWQLLVLGIETGTRKKIPEKVKNTISLVGLGLLLILMVAIVFKDVFTYIIPGVFLL